MAIRNSAGSVLFTLNNTNRGAANPPIVFNNFGNGINTSFSIWVKINSGGLSNVQLFMEGTDGSLFFIHHDGSRWHYHLRTGSVDGPTHDIGPVIIGRWTVLCVVMNNQQVRVYVGYEGSPANADTPVVLTLPSGAVDVHNHTYTLNRIGINILADASVTNFKYWNTAITQVQMAAQCNRWDFTGPVGAPPMWVSTLRTPGDLSNVTNPYSAPDWAAGHAFTAISQPEALTYDFDPAYLNKNSPCPTWLYPIDGIQIVNANPGTTPAAPTFYKGPQRYQFHDRGSIPLNVPLVGLTYYGYPSKLGTDVGPTDTLPLYRNELGYEVTDLTQRFETNTGVATPVALNATNIFNWVFGAQFRYGPPAGQVTAEGLLRFLYLYTLYTGTPTGIGLPHVVPPPIDPGDPPPEPVPVPIKMSGLFAINKGGLNIDNYDPDIQLKIPNPTIKTAFIGE